MIADDQQSTPTLRYRSPETPPLLPRWKVVAFAGAAIALVGVIVFLSADAVAKPAPGVSYILEKRRMDEVLWAVFGIALLMAGALVAAVGLWSWCRDQEH
jgi:hypothetical protein